MNNTKTSTEKNNSTEKKSQEPLSLDRTFDVVDMHLAALQDSGACVEVSAQVAKVLAQILFELLGLEKAADASPRIILLLDPRKADDEE
jgi:hypothetical protein